MKFMRQIPARDQRDRKPELDPSSGCEFDEVCDYYSVTVLSILRSEDVLTLTDQSLQHSNTMTGKYL